jgi:hypothetical protein
MRSGSSLLLDENREAQIFSGSALRRRRERHGSRYRFQAPAIIEPASAAGPYSNEHNFAFMRQTKLDFTIPSPPHASRGMTGELQAHIPQIGVPHRLPSPLSDAAPFDPACSATGSGAAVCAGALEARVTNAGPDSGSPGAVSAAGAGSGTGSTSPIGFAGSGAGAGSVATSAAGAGGSSTFSGGAGGGFLCGGSGSGSCTGTVTGSSTRLTRNTSSFGPSPDGPAGASRKTPASKPPWASAARATPAI